MNNREVANLIVQEICTTLMQLPSEKDWKKLVDFAERKIEAAQQSGQGSGPVTCPVCGYTGRIAPNLAAK